MHAPVGVLRDWLARVLGGHYAYYGLPSNWHRIDTFYDEVCRIWYRVLDRRSQQSLAWTRFAQIFERSLCSRAHLAPAPGVAC
jgi:hypothetical protein